MAVSVLGITIISAIVIIALLALVLGIYFGTRPTNVPYTVIVVNSGGLFKVDQFGSETQGEIWFTFTGVGDVLGFEIIPSVPYSSVSGVTININKPSSVGVITTYHSATKVTVATIGLVPVASRDDPLKVTFTVNT